LLEGVLEHEGHGVAVVGEGQLTRQQLVEHGGDGVDVGGGAEVAAACLLGSDVGRRAHDLTRPCRHGLLATHHLGDPEVGHLERTRAREHQVLGLDVAVQHPAPVGGLQPGQAGQHDGAGSAGGEAVAREAAPHRAPGEELHHEQAEAVLFDEVVDRHDVGVVEGGQEPRLDGEAGPDRLVDGEGAGELLDGDVAAELAVLAGQDDTPAAPTELPADLIGGEGVDHRLLVEAHAVASLSAGVEAVGTKNSDSSRSSSSSSSRARGVGER